MVTWVLVETAKLQIEELLMGHRNRVPISHKFNFFLIKFCSIANKGIYCNSLRNLSLFSDYSVLLVSRKSSFHQSYWFDTYIYNMTMEYNFIQSFGEKIPRLSVG